MRFERGSRRLAAGALLLGATACAGATRERRHTFVVGNFPEIQSGLGLWSDMNTVVMTSQASQSIEQFTLSPPAHVRSVPLARFEKDQLALPSADAGYYVTLSGYGYAVVKADGQATVDPMPVPGDLIGAAFGPSQGVLGLMDDEQNLVFATIAKTGDVTGTWKTSAQLPNKEWAISATMLADGTLLLGGSGSHLSLVDVAGSVGAQAWKETDVAVASASDLRWVAAVSGSGQQALALDANRLVVVDLKDGTVLDQKSLGSALVLGAFRDLTPHVVSQTQDEQQANTFDVTYVDTNGKLATVNVAGTTNQLTQSLLDVGGGTVALAADPDQLQSPSYNFDWNYYASRAVSRFRLTNGSLIDATSPPGEVALALRPAGAVGLHDAALGKADLMGYGPAAPATTLEGYDYQTLLRLDSP